MNGNALDDLARSLLPYSGEEVMVVDVGFRARVFLDTILYPDEIEADNGSWLVRIMEVVEDSRDRGHKVGDMWEITLNSPSLTPLRIETHVGEVIWARESKNT
jgi:hypothetical protein